MFHGGIAGGRSHGGDLGEGTRDAIYFDGTGNGGDPDGAEETLQVWRVKVELTAHGTEAEAGIRETPLEPVRQMTTVELEGRRSLV